jgi:beta-lactamase regulating signal transducer with metallopeptidase domain
VFASFVILPDESTDRILLITLPLLLITRLTALRQLAFWLISVVAAIVAFSVSYAADMPLPLLHTHPSVARALVSVGTWLGGAYASPRYVIFENLPMVLLLGLFIADKVRGRSQSVTTHSAQTSSEVVA